jgi:hypothetical protein
MIFVLAFLLVVGNAYYQKSRVEFIVTQATYAGAAYCAEPLLKFVESDGKVPEFTAGKDSRAKPYRYLIVNKDKIGSETETRIYSKLDELGTGLFSGMKVQDPVANAEYNNYVVYATLSTDVKYKITVPVKLLGMKDFMSIPISSHTEVAVSDVPEFIRNINAVKYYLTISGVKDKIDDTVDKVLSFLKK